jgi:hypothetical protein
MGLDKATQKRLEDFGCTRKLSLELPNIHRFYRYLDNTKIPSHLLLYLLACASSYKKERPL